MKTLRAPIPGQSLTDTPKNYPWERPPETADPNEAIMMHIDKLSQPDVIDDLLYALEFGLPVKTITDSIMTAAVGSGWHSIDVGLIIKPVVFEYIVSIAKEAGVSYKEEFTDGDPSEKARQRGRNLFAAALAKAPKGSDFQFLEELSQEQPAQEEPPMTEEEPKGLMSRRG